MMTMTLEAEQLKALLREDVSDVVLRLALADALEECGQTEEARLQRQLAAQRPTAALTPEQRGELESDYATWFGIAEDQVRIDGSCFSEELVVYGFRVDSQCGNHGDPVHFLICRESLAFSMGITL